MSDQKKPKLERISWSIIRWSIVLLLGSLIIKSYQNIITSKKITEVRGEGGVRCFTYKDSISCLKDKSEGHDWRGKDQVREI